MQVQWFPGHMAKTRRIIQERLKLIDVVIEIVDARIPQSSRNPLLDNLIEKKPRVIILNKEDLADEKITKQWLDYFNKESKYKAFKINSTVKKTNVLKDLKEALYQLTQEKREQKRAKGIKKIVIRTMVVGIPNVGKSTFINIVVGKKAAKTGNKPGVTRGQQWIRLDEDIELLDTPGILWPKFEDPEVGFKLAITGAISDDVFDVETAAFKLTEFLLRFYPELLAKRYKLSEEDLEKPTLEVFDQIGKKRGCLLPGNKVDYLKISTLLINEFRAGKIGRISLEKPEFN